jgi:hypothetical protein
MYSITEQIREALGKPHGVTEDVMQPLAAAYAEEVGKVNERLAECVRLLMRGLRSEAIQLANLRPNVIDAAARLDFNEFDDWLEILQFLDVSLPPGVNRDAVQQLQEALVDEQPLEAMLRQHRRLAIGKAPLVWRLRVLRNIAQADADNVVWQEDLEVWERQRIREIEDQLAKSAAAGNAADCQALHDELQHPNWLIQPPGELIARARKQAEDLTHRASLKQLAEYAAQLNDAFCAQDETRARTLREQWQRHVGGMLKAPPRDVTAAAEPALLWLEERDAYAAAEEAHLQAAANLERLIDNSRSLEELERAYAAATRQEFALDPVLEKRYQVRVSEIQLAGRRRVILMVSAIAATCLIAISVFGVWQWQSMREAEIQRTVASLQGMLSEGRLQEAATFVSQVSNTKPDIAGTAGFSALASELAGRQTAEQERVRAFEQYLTDAAHDDPEKIDLAALNRAEGLAASDTEKAEVFRLKTRRSEWEQRLEREQLDAVRTELNSLSEEVARIEKGATERLTDADFERILSRLSELPGKYPRAGATATQLVDSMQRKVSGLRDGFRSTQAARQKEALALERFRTAATLDEYRQAVQAAVKDVPDAPFVQSLKAVQAETPLWERALQWNQVALALEGLLKAKTLATADRFLAAQAALAGQLRFALLDRAEAELPASVEKMRAREQVLTTLRNELKDAVPTNLVAVEYLPMKDKPAVRRFAYAAYLKREDENIKRANDKGTSLSLNVVANTDGSVVAQPMYPPIAIRTQPQQFFVGLISDLEQNRERILANWDVEILKVVARTLKDDSGLDATLRPVLAFHVLNAGMKGSLFLEQRCRGIARFLENELNLRDLWVKPLAVSESQTLDGKLRSGAYEPLAAIYQAAGATDAEWLKIAGKRLSWAGWIDRKANGSYEPLLKLGGKTSGELYVVVEDPTRSGAELIAVGSVVDGVPNLAAGSSALVFGRPLFLLSDS